MNTPGDPPRSPGLAGWLTRGFITSPLTPLFLIAALAFGLIALISLPREEEPQISVPMVDIRVQAPGLRAEDAVKLVTEPLETIVKGIDGVEHIYSQTQDDGVLVTARFLVGTSSDAAVLRVHDKLRANMDRIPQGIPEPQVVGRGIDDVAIVALTLSARPDAAERVTAAELTRIARELRTELAKIDDVGLTYLIGETEEAIRVAPDPARLALYGITLQQLAGKVQGANRALPAGMVREDGRQVMLVAGETLRSPDEIGNLVLTARDGRPVYVRDVADLGFVGDTAEALVATLTRDSGRRPAVTLALAKRAGANAVTVAEAILHRAEALQGTLIPDDMQVEITRDYGETANEKANELLYHLGLATLSIIALVWLAIGRREALVVAVVIPVTILLTLFASWIMGYTLNRVSLFALIFSIGILVDDAIVVVENIHRHMARDGKSLFEAIPPAVDEVGGPTILATFTVIAALMPMAFVTGLMGPYMRPIPINASVGMLLSLAIALIVTPWLSLKLLARHGHAAETDHDHEEKQAGWLHRLFERVMSPFLRGERAGRRRGLLFASMAGLVLLASSLAVFKLVILKMLPFDNKSEVQIVVDMPEGSTLEQTNALLAELAAAVDTVPEVLDYQAYAGTAAPINFNGLVRQYFLRSGSNVGDLQVNLVDKHHRKRQSHEIALAMRPMLAKLGEKYGASVKVVEVPPGPPVLSPLVAEVYGPDYAGQRKVALALAKERFATTDGIVDIDTTVEADAPREQIVVDRERAARLGVPQSAIADAIAMGVSGLDATYVHDGASKYPRPVRLRLPAQDQAALSSLLALKVRSARGQLVPLSELVRVEKARWDGAIYHKDGLPVVYVTADEAGKLDSPLYGMFGIVSQLDRDKVDGQTLAQTFIAQPTDTSSYAVKWDGEWQITYETFRDMGIAYAAGMVLIYLLVVAQFRSYLVPLVIMAPIPLTIIGVMPGHALLGKQFTATSMIGMIALAGIIVRNSILLVDFINQETERGVPLVDAVIDACAVRAKPIVLTGVAAMLGAFFILDDPIFNGLAISLIFGIFVSTLLTLVVIPLLYYVLRKHELAKAARA